MISKRYAVADLLLCREVAGVYVVSPFTKTWRKVTFYLLAKSNEPSLTYLSGP
jgi:hypothetical protein